MKIKTSELTSPALDWAVAKAASRLDQQIRDGARPGAGIIDIGLDEQQNILVYVPGKRRNFYVPWRPSTDWSQGGPIIEREKLSPRWSPLWKHWGISHPRNAALALSGPTYLIAAMRCFVASRLGDEVEVPEELL